MNFQRSKNSYQEEDLRSSEARNSLFETLCCRDWPVLGWTIWLNYLWLCSTIKLQSKYKWIQVKTQSKTVPKSQFTINLFDVLFCFDYIGLPSSRFAGKRSNFQLSTNLWEDLERRLKEERKLLISQNFNLDFDLIQELKEHLPIRIHQTSDLLNIINFIE
jgi:hypothetical protein